MEIKIGQIVKDKLTGIAMIVVEIKATTESTFLYNCRFMNTINGSFEYVMFSKEELKFDIRKNNE